MPTPLPYNAKSDEESDGESDDEQAEDVDAESDEDEAEAIYEESEEESDEDEAEEANDEEVGMYTCAHLATNTLAGHMSSRSCPPHLMQQEETSTP